MVSIFTQNRCARKVMFNKMETKTCKFCGEEVIKAAIKCRYCGEWLDIKKKEEALSDQKQQINTKIFRNSFFAALIIAVILNIWEYVFGVKFSPGSGTFSHFIITTIVLTFVFIIGGFWARIFDKLSS